MKAVIQQLVLIMLLGMSAVGAHAAEEKSWRDLPHDIALDIDNDGKMDRAVLVETNGGSADLYIYLGAGTEMLDLSRKPAILKKDLTTNLILGFESKHEGSLIVTYGCGGCSNDFSTTLKIVYRRGGFWVAGVTYDWDTRNGMGSCDINFLTGKGFFSRGLDGKKKPIRAKLTPIKLANWSEDKRPNGC